MPAARAAGRRIETAQSILGQAGMATTGDALPQVDIAELKRASRQLQRSPLPHAVDAMIEAIRLHAGEITLMCIAPLTNVAVALQRAPEIASMVKKSSSWGLGRPGQSHGGGRIQHLCRSRSGRCGVPAPASRCACSA
jgi:inosine-uridine nucleoside N-ribohydrolase